MNAATAAPTSTPAAPQRPHAANTLLSRLPRGFLGVKLAPIQRNRRFPSAPSFRLGNGAGMTGHDGSFVLPSRSRTSAQGTPEDLHPHSRAAHYDADRGVGHHNLAQRDTDTHEAIATGYYYATALDQPDQRWHPNKLDAAMAAASIGIGILSGLTAGSITWWATGEHPHLLNLRGHMHLSGHRA